MNINADRFERNRLESGRSHSSALTSDRLDRYFNDAIKQAVEYWRLANYLNMADPNEIQTFFRETAGAQLNEVS